MVALAMVVLEAAFLAKTVLRRMVCVGIRSETMDNAWFLKGRRLRKTKGRPKRAPDLRKTPSPWTTSPLAA